MDMFATFDTIQCDKLLEITEKVLSQKDGARMLKLLLTDATIEIRMKDGLTTAFTSHIGAPQGGSYSGPQFELYFENSLRKSRRETGITNQKGLHEEMVYAYDYDNLTEDLEKKRKFKEKAVYLLSDDNLMVNDDKTEDTMLKRFKNRKDNFGDTESN